jgi:hypothetical protein
MAQARPPLGGGGGGGEGRLGSRSVCARSTSFELAVFALEYEPVRARAAHATVPQEERCFRLDNLEGMVAVARDCHCFSLVGDCERSGWADRVTAELVGRDRGG